MLFRLGTSYVRHHHRCTCLFRIQLERPNYLHFAECEIFGVLGTNTTIGCVTAVTCGHSVTGVVMGALTDDECVYSLRLCTRSCTTHCNSFCAGELLNNTNEPSRPTQWPRVHCCLKCTIAALNVLRPSQRFCEACRRTSGTTTTSAEKSIPTIDARCVTWIRNAKYVTRASAARLRPHDAHVGLHMSAQISARV